MFVFSLIIRFFIFYEVGGAFIVYWVVFLNVSGSLGLVAVLREGFY